MRLSEDKIKELIDEAIKARENAYTPYSHFKVGALVVDEKGHHHSGCNVENGSMVLLIAENELLFIMVLVTV